MKPAVAALAAAVVLVAATVSTSTAATAPTTVAGTGSCTTDATGTCTIHHSLGVTPDSVVASPATPGSFYAYMLNVVGGSFTSDSFKVRAMFSPTEPKQFGTIWVSYLASVGQASPPAPSPTPTSPAPLVTTASTPPPTSTAVPVPTSTPAPPSSTVAPVPAAAQWSLVGSDTFSGSALDSAKWAVYDTGGSTDGAGNRRVPADCVVGGGELKITANGQGNCGMAWVGSKDQTYGAWEVHARFQPSTNGEFDTTFIAWPSDDALWQNAEIDYVEQTDPSRQTVGAFVHCTACGGGQLDAAPNGHPVDMTQWHTYRLEWTPSAITLLIDGQAWWHTTDTAAITTVPHHGTLQTDSPVGAAGSSTVEVDAFRLYAWHS